MKMISMLGATVPQFRSPRTPTTGQSSRKFQEVQRWSLLRATGHVLREPVNTLVILLNELFNFKSLKLLCFSFFLVS